MRIGLDARLAGSGLGVATLISALASGLPGPGTDVVWFGEAGLAPDAVAEVAPPPPPGYPGLDSARGRRLAAAHRVDVMHFAANSGWWSPGPVPFVLTVHDLIWRRPTTRGRTLRQVSGHAYLRAAVPRAIRGAAAVTAPSATSAAAVRARYRVPVEVVHHGVSEEWRHPARSVDPADPYVVAFSGRDPRKGTEIALEAWARVAPRGVRLVLLTGAGLPPRLEPRLDELRAGGRLEVLPYQPGPVLAAMVAGAVALVYPSRDEGFGLPVIEAMAAGTPVITGLAPVTLEIGGEAVLRLGAADPVTDAAGHLARLLDQPQLRPALAARGRARAAAYTWSAALARYRALYEGAVGR